MRYSLFAFAAVCCVVLAVPMPVLADAVPQLINYQGKVYQPSGAAVPDGAYKVAFSIYDVPTGGTAIWTETYDALQVKGSAFHVLLGSNNPIGASIFGSADRFLGVKLASDAELAPRQKIASVPYAMVAEKARHAEQAAAVAEGSITEGKLAQSAATGAKLAATQKPKPKPVKPKPQAAAPTSPVEVQVTVNPKDGAELVRIPAGVFVMGSNDNDSDEKPRRCVYLSDYWIGKYEVTRGEYRRFIEAGGYSNPAYWSSAGWSWKGSRTEPRYWAADQKWYSGQPFTQTDSHPVVGVTYYEAEAYCAWAGGHLPTEAQWEKAARWTDGREYPWGNEDYKEMCNNAFDANPAGGGREADQTAPVGSYPAGASPYGCLDMAGNVLEWCADWYNSGYYSVSVGTDPQGTSSGSDRVQRGGAWSGGGAYCRCAYRDASTPSTTGSSTGFRIAR